MNTKNQNDTKAIEKIIKNMRHKQGMSLGAIAKELNASSFRTSTGKLFGKANVYYYLNPEKRAHIVNRAKKENKNDTAKNAANVFEATLSTFQAPIPPPTTLTRGYVLQLLAGVASLSNDDYRTISRTILGA